jgi:hypothetical protein
MTDQQAMQLALDALTNTVEDSHEAVNAYIGSYGESHRPARLAAMRKTVADGYLAAKALENALARPERKPLSTLFKLALYNLEADDVLELESYLQGIEDAEAAHGIKETE